LRREEEDEEKGWRAARGPREPPALLAARRSLPGCVFMLAVVRVGDKQEAPHDASIAVGATDALLAVCVDNGKEISHDRKGPLLLVDALAVRRGRRRGPSPQRLERREDKGKTKDERGSSAKQIGLRGKLDAAQKKKAESHVLFAGNKGLVAAKGGDKK